MKILNLPSLNFRYFSNGLSYIFKKDTVWGGPGHVHIELTNICNFRCIYCPQSLPREHFQILGRGKMEFATFQQILDKITHHYRIERLVLTRDGEPLIHPRLEDFVGYATSRGLKTTVGSNGSLITPERAEKLIRNGLSLMKGDFCYDPETYERLRVGAEFQKSLQGYRNILKAARRMNANFLLVLVDLNSYYLRDSREKESSMEKLRSLFTGYEKWLDVGPAVMHSALGESQVTLSSSGPEGSGNHARYNLCHHPWLEMVIDYKGNMVACCRDLRSEYQIGNILNVDDIHTQLWNGEKMRLLRKHLANKEPEKLEICRKCDLPYGVSYAGRSISGKIIRFLKS